MFQRFSKNRYWQELGDVAGFHRAVEQLGSSWCLLDEENEGFTQETSIWGQLAQVTDLKNKTSLKARKWLYNVWQEDRHGVKSKFYATKQISTLPTTSNNVLKRRDDVSTAVAKKTEELLPIVSTTDSIKSDFVRKYETRLKDKISPTKRDFSVSYEEWQSFYNRKTAKVAKDWSDKLTEYFTRVPITCSITFKKHTCKKKHSRKKNCDIFKCHGKCQRPECPVRLSVTVEEGPKNQGAATIFYVEIYHEPNHHGTAQRPLKGTRRAAMAKQVSKMGALAVYEQNMRNADEELLREGNFTEVPSTDVLKTAGQEYSNRYRLDEDMFKELRIFRELTERLDQCSKDVKGFIQTSAEWPFATYFFTEQQLDRFAQACKKNTYSYLHIDATGSVIKKLLNQDAVFFYAMVYKDEKTDSSILPLSGALLSDQKTAAINAYFSCVLSRLALRHKTTRPSFVVIDFSAALLNSVLSSFNNENINSYLRRCSNTLDKAYTVSQLKNTTFVRLCCSHVMKAFSRSLHKITQSKEAHRQLMTLFGILLNSTDIEGAFDLYEKIVTIYADPHDQDASRKAKFLLTTVDQVDEEFHNYLNEELYEDDDEKDQSHFLDEIDITKDAIIHQSPFNIKACARIPTLDRIIKKEKLHQEITNSMFSTKIVQLLYKWFAYLPLWSCIMTDFVERYAKDSNKSNRIYDFGHGRISNALIESYFSIVKESVLQKKTRLRPLNFLMEMYLHTQSRIKGDAYKVPQSSSGRKRKDSEPHSLNFAEVWSRRPRSNSTSQRSSYFGKAMGNTQAFKLTSKQSQRQNGKHDERLALHHAEELLPTVHSMNEDQSDDSSNDEAGVIESLQLSLMQQVCEVAYEESILPTDPLPTSFIPELENPGTFDDVETTEPDPVSKEPVLDAPQMASEEQELRRGARRRTPNSRYTRDYISPSISPMNKRPEASKRKLSPSVSRDRVASKPPKPPKPTKKNEKENPQPPTKSLEKSEKDKKTVSITTVGNMKMPWPRYGIDNITLDGRTFSITNTCPLDTGLFIYFHAYITGSDKFRRIFEKDDMRIYSTLRRTFQLAQENSWDDARLYWLIKHDLIPKQTSESVYDLTNTLTEIVFRFLQPLQQYTIQSECSCLKCPRRFRQTTSNDLVLTKSANFFVNYLPSFTDERVSSCGENLGANPPTDYPGTYWRDDSFPVKNLENNETTTERRYICKSDRTTSPSQFHLQNPPFLLLNVPGESTFIADLPERLHVGKNKYDLSAGTNNTRGHFTAMIKTNTGEYVRFNDLHHSGCFPLDGFIPIDFALYRLSI